MEKKKGKKLLKRNNYFTELPDILVTFFMFHSTSYILPKYVLFRIAFGCKQQKARQQ